MNRAVLHNEMHVHAQQLMRFCREHNLGFVLAFLNSEYTCERVTNLDDEQLRFVGACLQSEPEEVSSHSVEEPS